MGRRMTRVEMKGSIIAGQSSAFLLTPDYGKFYPATDVTCTIKFKSISPKLLDVDISETDDDKYDFYLQVRIYIYVVVIAMKEVLLPL